MGFDGDGHQRRDPGRSVGTWDKKPRMKSERGSGGGEGMSFSPIWEASGGGEVGKEGSLQGREGLEAYWVCRWGGELPD